MRTRVGGVRVALVVAVLAGAGLSGAWGDETYRAEVQKWRVEREAGLKAEGGWLSVAGLYWLRDGPNRFGTDPGNDMVLPLGASAAHAGAFELKDGKVTVRLEPGVEGTIDAQPAQGREMRPDSSGKPDVLSLGRLRLTVIQRTERIGIRLKDPENPNRLQFYGLDWYGIAEPYRVRARFVAYDVPKSVRVPNVLGQSLEMTSPGLAVFEIDGKEVKLEAVLEEPGAEELFFIIHDATSGKETYPGGRFLYSDLPKDGQVVLDFNKAYNPPCAFTAFATCPLPPRQNWMPVRVEAGEKRYGGHGAE